MEHRIRAKASELGLKNGGPDEAYVRENLDAALGHEYRAFFDVCDWLSVQLRKKIRLTLEPYSTAALNAAVPDYYKEVRPQLEKITLEIAAGRSGKDIAVQGDLLQEVTRYNAVIARLKAFVVSLPAAVTALESFKQKEAVVISRLNTCARHARQLRDEICGALEPYSPAAINSALSDYYNEVRL